MTPSFKIFTPLLREYEKSDSGKIFVSFLLMQLPLRQNHFTMGVIYLLLALHCNASNKLQLKEKQVMRACLLHPV